MALRFPYGRGEILADFSEEDVVGVLDARLPEVDAPAEALVRRALAEPLGAPRLSELARGKRNVVVIVSDHTRPVPSRAILPPMLEEIRRGNPEAEVTLLVATGCHRASTETELREKLGAIYDQEKVVVHDCDDEANLVDLGRLPSGGAFLINRLAAEADLLVAEGFIEPHFFAGFSGGRKSVLPGICGRKTVLANHCAAFIDDPRARTGVLAGNPIHRDMLWAARRANLSFIVNVILGEGKRAAFAYAGDVEEAHAAGCAMLAAHCRVPRCASDIAVVTNGGYPLDQNLYQAVKGMTAAEAAVRPGGVILMLAGCADGVGGENFYRQIAGEADLGRVLARFRARRPEETEPDQWQSQILIRVLQKARVLLCSELPDDVVRAMHMEPVASLSAGLARAKALLKAERPKIALIPDGVSVFAEEE